MAEGQDNSRNEVEIDLDKYMAMIEKLDQQEDQIKEMKEEARLAAERLGPRKRKFIDLFLDDNDLSYSWTMYFLRYKNIFDISGDINFGVQKIKEIKNSFPSFNFCSILTLPSGSNSEMIDGLSDKVSDIRPMIAVTKLDECWVGAEEFSSLAKNNSRIGIVTGTKVLIDSIIEANENSLTKYMKENFKGV